MSTFDSIRSYLCSQVRGLDPSNLLVFSDRKDRVIAVALTEFVLRPAIIEPMMRALMHSTSTSVEYVATIGPCWYSSIRRPLPLTMMTRARLEALRVWLDRRLEDDDPQLAYALASDHVEFRNGWEAWAIAIANEFGRRAADGEPHDPVFDASFETDCAGLNELAWSSVSTEPLHLGCSPARRSPPRPTTSPGYTMHEARCERCSWATETGRRERTVQYARNHIETTPCGSSSIYLAMVEYENGEEVSRIVEPRPEPPRWTGAMSDVGRRVDPRSSPAPRSGDLRAEMGIDAAELAGLRRAVEADILNLTIARDGRIEATAENRERVRWFRLARATGVLDSSGSRASPGSMASAPPPPREPTRMERAAQALQRMGIGRAVPTPDRKAPPADPPSSAPTLSAPTLCPQCQISPDPRGWSACFGCRELRA